MPLENFVPLKKSETGRQNDWQIRKNIIDMDYQRTLQKYQVTLATQYSVPGLIFGYLLSGTLSNLSLLPTNILWGVLLTIPTWIIMNGLKQRIENELVEIKKQVEKLF